MFKETQQRRWQEDVEKETNRIQLKQKYLKKHAEFFFSLFK